MFPWRRLVGKTGARIGRLILLDDITQRVSLEEQMLQTEKLTSLGLLAAGVAHEVNTPLAVISNYIQMLAKQLPSDDPKQKTIEKIVKQTFRASEIVNNLLNFSRTGAAQFVEVNMNSVLDETLTLVQHPFRTVESERRARVPANSAPRPRFHHAAAASVPESLHERPRRHADRRNARSPHRRPTMVRLKSKSPTPAAEFPPNISIASSIRSSPPSLPVAERD